MEGNMAQTHRQAGLRPAAQQTGLVARGRFKLLEASPAMIFFSTNCSQCISLCDLCSRDLWQNVVALWFTKKMTMGLKYLQWNPYVKKMKRFFFQLGIRSIQHCYSCNLISFIFLVLGKLQMCLVFYWLELKCNVRRIVPLDPRFEKGDPGSPLLIRVCRTSIFIVSRASRSRFTEGPGQSTAQLDHKQLSYQTLKLKLKFFAHLGVIWQL